MPSSWRLTGEEVVAIAEAVKHHLDALEAEQDILLRSVSETTFPVLNSLVERFESAAKTVQQQ